MDQQPLALSPNLFNDGPLGWANGRIHIHPAFAQDKAMVPLLALAGSNETRYQDLLALIYYMHALRSPYHKMLPKERYKLCMKERVSDRAFVRTLKGKEMVVAVQRYLQVSCTPTERLYKTLQEAVETYMKQLAELEVTAENKRDVIGRIDAGIDLMERAKTIEGLMKVEIDKRARGGHAKQLFEDPPENTRIAS